MTATAVNMCWGAKEIAAYAFGDESKYRRVYRLIERYDPPHIFPTFMLGGTVCARKSDIDEWVASRLRAANDHGEEKQDAA